MRNRKLVILFFSIVCLLGILAVGCSKEANEPDSSEETVYEENDAYTAINVAGRLGSLKSFSAVALDGSTFTEEDIAAKDITVINFWGLTCGPCIREMPDIAAFAKALPDNVQMITVCLDGEGDQETAKDILSEAGYEGVTLLSGDGDFESVCRNLQYTPTTVVVDSEGNLVGKAIIGGQKDLSGTLLEAVNFALKSGGKAEINLEE